MMKSKRLYLRQLLDTNTRTGLELEYENVSHDITHDTLYRVHEDMLWQAERDGSLRPGDQNTELKFGVGLSGKQVIAALNQLAALDDLPYKISWRCGMHVHTDYSGLINDVAFRALIISSILEPAMFTWCGAARVESKFCSPTSYSSDYVLRGNHFQPQKYTAFNLAPLQGLGTCELRVADSTRDTRLMLDYINLGFELRRLGREFESGWHILDTMVQHKTSTTWIERHLHPEVAKFLVPAAEESIDKMKWIDGFASAALMAEREEKLEKFAIG